MRGLSSTNLRESQLSSESALAGLLERKPTTDARIPASVQSSAQWGGGAMEVAQIGRREQRLLPYGRGDSKECPCLHGVDDERPFEDC